MFSEAELQTAGSRFAIVGPECFEAEIDTIFPGSFPGKEDLIQFYVRFNGGSRTEKGCLMSCGNPAHRVSRDALDNMQLEGFMSVSSDPNNRMLPFRPILGHQAAMRRIYDAIPETKAFLERNVPFAFDHSGNDLCIDLEGGGIHFMNWQEYRLGAIEIAPDFRSFTLKYWVHAHATLETDF